MQIRNPFTGSDPLNLLVLTSDGQKTPMQTVSRPLLELPDDTVEAFIECPFRGQKLVKVWTKQHGLMEVDEYESRKRLAEEKAEFEKAKQRRRREPQLDVKVTPQNENDSPPSN